MNLTDLSPELLLSISSYLSQTDLLNVTLVCKYLRAATEPELFREYVNPKMHSRSFVPFVKMLIERPELRRYIQRLELKGWNTLEEIGPKLNDFDLREFEYHVRQTLKIPNESDYRMFGEAALAAGVLTSVAPYEKSSGLLRRARRQFQRLLPSASPWHQNIFDSQIHTDDVHYDEKFCQMLRAGIEDPFAVLLVALLPNVSEIHLHGAPQDLHALTWNIPRHNFRALRSFIAEATDGELLWPAAFFNDLLQTAPLETIILSGCGSWFREPTPSGEDIYHSKHFNLAPRSLRVKELVLDNCCFTYKDMENLIHACHNLETLYYSVRSARMETGTDNFTMTELVAILAQVQGTLKDLFVDMTSRWYYEKDPDPVQSLSEFTRLETLWTTSDFFQNLLENDLVPETDQLYQRLPRSIVEMRLFEGRYIPSQLRAVSFRQIRDLLAARSEALPNLRNLTIIGKERRLRDLKGLERLYGTNFDADGHETFVLDISSTQQAGLPETVLNHHHPSYFDNLHWVEDRYAKEKSKHLISDEKFREDPRKAIEEECREAGLDEDATERRIIDYFEISERMRAMYGETSSSEEYESDEEDGDL